MAGLKRERRGYRMMEETVEKVKDFDQRLMARQLELVLLKTKVLQRESLRLNLSLNCRSVSFDS